MPKKIFDIKSFGIDLTFACLREAASAKAGILAFDIQGKLYRGDTC